MRGKGVYILANATRIGRGRKFLKLYGRSKYFQQTLYISAKHNKLIDSKNTMHNDIQINWYLHGKWVSQYSFLIMWLFPYYFFYSSSIKFFCQLYSLESNGALVLHINNNETIFLYRWQMLQHLLGGGAKAFWNRTCVHKAFYMPIERLLLKATVPSPPALQVSVSTTGLQANIKHYN